ncbi:MAG: alpha/beta hydrolase [Clostridia bacterium]|nr:alpha/beta hydrolase [Clostridia bacterium]
MKKLFKVLGIIAAIFLVLIIALFALLWYWSTLPAVKEGYYENTVTGGDIEAKYTLKGSYEVASTEYDAEDDTVGKYEIWYPAEMETSGKTYPLVVMVNGTGVPASKYEAVFDHLASWGFIVIGNENENPYSGLSSSMSLDFMLELNGDNASVFYGKVDTINIGIGGHSQGGVGTINAVTAQDNGSMYTAMYTASATSKYWTQSTEWEYDVSGINIPYLMVAGTGYIDAGTAENITVEDEQGICPLYSLKENYNNLSDDVDKVMMRRVDTDHGDMLPMADGYMTAWFMYYLQGDTYAGGAFTGSSAEILSNSVWQDVNKNI